MSETGTVGTYGGINIPTVTIFMKGFQLGIEKATRRTALTSNHRLGQRRRRWSVHRGLREPGQRPRDDRRTLDDGADIILPVAGPVGLGTIEAIRRLPGQQRQGHLGRHRRLRQRAGRLRPVPDLGHEEHGRGGA